MIRAEELRSLSVRISTGRMMEIERFYHVCFAATKTTQAAGLTPYPRLRGNNRAKEKGEKMKIINVSPHEMTFADPKDPERIITVPSSGILINAKFEEEPAGNHISGAALVRTRLVPNPESEAELARLENENPGAVIVGSIIAAQAFPGRVFALISVPGFERVHTDKKRMRMDKFTTFGDAPQT